jgi:RecB family exonuclease
VIGDHDEFDPIASVSLDASEIRVRGRVDRISVAVGCRIAEIEDVALTDRI